MTLSARRTHQRKLDVLRRVLGHLLEEAALGTTFTWRSVASNSMVRGQPRIVDAHSLSGHISTPAKKLLRNLLHQGHIVAVTGRTYRVRPESQAFLRDLQHKTSEDILWGLSAEDLDACPRNGEEDDASMDQNPFEDHDGVIPQAEQRGLTGRHPKATVIQAMREVLQDRSMRASEVLACLTAKGIYPNSGSPITYIRHLLIQRREDFERDLRGFYRAKT